MRPLGTQRARVKAVHIMRLPVVVEELNATHIGEWLNPMG